MSDWKRYAPIPLMVLIAILAAPQVHSLLFGEYTWNPIVDRGRLHNPVKVLARELSGKN
ncbi:MAG: hypothetical protein QXO01_04495 [Nitrososphaerota archaeon]